MTAETTAISLDEIDAALAAAGPGLGEDEQRPDRHPAAPRQLPDRHHLSTRTADLSHGPLSSGPSIHQCPTSRGGRFGFPASVTTRTARSHSHHPLHSGRL